MQRLFFDQLGGRTGSHHIAVTRLRSGQHTFVHTHDFVEVFLIEEGRGLHCWNNRELPVQRGSLTLVQPRDIHSFKTGAGGRLVLINLAFPMTWWAAFQRVLSPTLALQRELLGNPVGHVNLDPSTCRNAAQTLHDLLERGAIEPTLLPEVVARLVRHLIAPPVVRQTAPKFPPWLRGLLSDLQDPALLAEPIAKWQKRAGVSPEHFARTCRRHLGESPTVVLNRARIESIKLRLRLGDEKITALALEAGFQNVSFFYRCFRRFAACTPKEWAAQHAAAVTVPR